MQLLITMGGDKEAHKDGSTQYHAEQPKLVMPDDREIQWPEAKLVDTQREIPVFLQALTGYVAVQVENWKKLEKKRESARASARRKYQENLEEAREKNKEYNRKWRERKRQKEESQESQGSKTNDAS